MRPITSCINPRFSNFWAPYGLSDGIFPTPQIISSDKIKNNRYLQSLYEQLLIDYVRLSTTNIRVLIVSRWEIYNLLLGFSRTGAKIFNLAGELAPSHSNTCVKNWSHPFIRNSLTAGIRGTRPYPSSTPPLNVAPWSEIPSPDSRRPRVRPRLDSGEPADEPVSLRCFSPKPRRFFLRHAIQENDDGTASHSALASPGRADTLNISGTPKLRRPRPWRTSSTSV